MPAQLKKLVVYANRGQAQQVFPNPGKDGFHIRFWRFERIAQVGAAVACCRGLRGFGGGGELDPFRKPSVQRCGRYGDLIGIQRR